MSQFFGMTVEPVKSVSGRTVWEVQHQGQTLSEPHVNKSDAEYTRRHFARIKGTPQDCLASYWARKNL